MSLTFLPVSEQEPSLWFPIAEQSPALIGHGHWGKSKCVMRMLGDYGFDSVQCGAWRRGVNGVGERWLGCFSNAGFLAQHILSLKQLNKAYTCYGNLGHFTDGWNFIIGL